MLSPLVGGLVLPQGVPAQVQAPTGDKDDENNQKMNIIAILKQIDWRIYNNRICLPQVGKVVKGHYLTLGASTLSSPSLNRFDELLS